MKQEVYTRALSFTTMVGERLQPTNFVLTLNNPPGNRPPSGQIEFDQLQLKPLVALSVHLPLPDRILADLARFSPQGTLTRGRLRWELRAILRGAAAVLARIEAVDGDVLGGRVHLTRFERVRTVFGGLLLRQPPRFHAEPA